MARICVPYGVMCVVSMPREKSHCVTPLLGVFSKAQPWPCVKHKLRLAAIILAVPSQKTPVFFLVAGLSHLALYGSGFHNLAAAILRHFHQTAIPLITRIILSACGHPSTRACVFSLTFSRLGSQVFLVCLIVGLCTVLVQVCLHLTGSRVF